MLFLSANLFQTRLKLPTFLNFSDMGLGRCLGFNISFMDVTESNILYLVASELGYVNLNVIRNVVSFLFRKPWFAILPGTGEECLKTRRESQGIL